MMMKGYMYILECANGCYYTGSTNNLERRLAEHQNGEGANFTKKHLPVKLLYFEEFQRIDEAFYREKQVQGWSRKKKEALINGRFDRLNDRKIDRLNDRKIDKLTDLSRNYTQFPRNSATVVSTDSVVSTGSMLNEREKQQIKK